MNSTKAPPVGALVTYSNPGRSPGNFRVTGWARVAQPQTYDFGCPEMNEVMREILEEGASLTFRRERMERCTREEATHLLLSGVAGCLAPVSECIVTGMVPWSAEHLREAALRAERHGLTHAVLI